MPLSWNEIKSRALAFSKHWADAGNEDAEAKPFLIAFFKIFGITNKRVASFEHAVKKHGGGYVTVGKIRKEPVEKYAKRKSMSVSEAGYWLAPILGHAR